MRKRVAKDIKSGDSGSILAGLFSTIMFDLGIDAKRFNILIERYMRRSNPNLNLKDASTMRGSLKKELLKDSISWKVFIKGLVFLNIKRFKIVLELEHYNGYTTKHEKSIIMHGETDNKH